jgi:hypothetical protein
MRAIPFSWKDEKRKTGQSEGDKNELQSNNKIHETA